MAGRLAYQPDRTPELAKSAREKVAENAVSLQSSEKNVEAPEVHTLSQTQSRAQHNDSRHWRDMLRTGAEAQHHATNKCPNTGRKGLGPAEQRENGHTQKTLKVFACEQERQAMGGRQQHTNSRARTRSPGPKSPRPHITALHTTDNKVGESANAQTTRHTKLRAEQKRQAKGQHTYAAHH